MPCKLVHLAGSKKGRTDTFAGPRIRIGRDPGNDLCFDPYEDRDASSKHAEISIEGEQWWLDDLGSTNGTFVNGERVTRHSLTEGDVIAFGRGGPKLRFDLNAAAQQNGSSPHVAAAAAPAAPPAHDAPAPEPAAAVGGTPDAGADAARADIPAPKLPGPKTMKLILKGAAAKAKSGSKSSLFGGTAVFVKEIVRQARDEATAGVRLMLAIVALLFLVLFVLVGWLAWQLNAKSEAIDTLSSELKAERAEFAQQSQDRLREEQAMFERMQEEARLQQERYTKELEQKLIDAQNAMGADAGEIDRLKAQLSNLRTPTIAFQEVLRAARPAIYLIYCRYEVKRKANAPADLPPARSHYEGFGTGFCVSSAGHIVTNKHVVKPWLFSRARAELDHNHMQVKTDPATGKARAYYAAWPVGERVLDRPGTRHLNFTTGFNNIVHSNLELVATAADQMRQFTTSATIGGKKQRVKVYAHDPQSQNDVAVLQATEPLGQPFETIAMANRKDLQRLKDTGALDPVAVIGFPRGIQVLEIGKATPSPTIGNIRKVEHTIHVSASISPGNSGGPLVNLQGKVIGIATRIINAETETHGVCIPITKAFDLLPKEFRPK